MKTKPKPPFRRGEFVFDHGHPRAVLKCYFVGSPELGCWWVKTDLSDDYATTFRRASARELRAEANRLTKRADALNAAADAIEQARKRVTEESSGTAKGKR